MTDVKEPKKRVLFLCTGNSCRSQMAEGLTNHILGGRWEAFSAGTQPSGEVHPMTLQVLNEIGIIHAGRSKSADEFKSVAFDVVITVCDEAEEDCPVWLGKGHSEHFNFPDPTKAVGTEAERLRFFRKTRNEIKEIVIPFLEDFADSTVQ